MGMGSEMVGFPIARSSRNSAARLLGSACTAATVFFSKNGVFWQRGRCSCTCRSHVCGKEGSSSSGVLGQRGIPIWRWGRGAFEAGTAGATLFGVGQVTGAASWTVAFSLVSVSTDPVAENPLSIAVAILCWFCLKTLANL